MPLALGKGPLFKDGISRKTVKIVDHFVFFD